MKIMKVLLLLGGWCLVLDVSDGVSRGCTRMENG